MTGDTNGLDLRSCHTAACILFVVAIAGFAQDYVPRVSGEISRGQEFKSDIGSGLLFLLKPTNTGWMVAVVPKVRCIENEDWASVVNPPYRNYNALYLDTAYGVTAEEAVSISPREFSFVTTCEAYKSESHRLEIVLWPYNYSKKEADEAMAKLGPSPLGKARLAIVKSKVSRAEHAIEGKNYGKIDWLEFRLDINPSVLRGRKSP
ncbi:MAG: hypothetical protein ACR2NN_19610 [Bryobacteraceae bacterium]